MPSTKRTAFTLKIRGYHTGTGLHLHGSLLTGIEASLHVPIKKGYCVDGFKWFPAVRNGDEMFILNVDATIKGNRFDIPLRMDRRLLVEALYTEPSKGIFQREVDSTRLGLTKAQIRKIATAVEDVFDELSSLGLLGLDLKGADHAG